MMNYETYPKKCPFCGNKIVFVNNKEIYGKSYGNAKVYLCRKCNAYTGTHYGTNVAVGVLANKEMRALRVKCHNIFDSIWRSCKNTRNKRNRLYEGLAEKMNIDRSHCHFGHFDTEELKMALGILERGELNDYLQTHN